MRDLVPELQGVMETLDDLDLLHSSEIVRAARDEISQLRAAGIAQGIEAEGRDRQGSVHESPTRRDAPPSPPPPPEGLPEEIVRAIDAYGAASWGDGAHDDTDPRSGIARSTLDTTILHHLSEKQERSRLEAEGWAQASVVSCYWIQSKPDHELVPVVNLDLRKLYEATHELALETDLSAARARAERAEKALRGLMEHYDPRSLGYSPDHPVSVARAALSPTQEP